MDSCIQTLRRTILGVICLLTAALLASCKDDELVCDWGDRTRDESPIVPGCSEDCRTDDFSCTDNGDGTRTCVSACHATPDCGQWDCFAIEPDGLLFCVGYELYVDETWSCEEDFTQGYWAAERHCQSENGWQCSGGSAVCQNDDHVATVSAQYMCSRTFTGLVQRDDRRWSCMVSDGTLTCQDLPFYEDCTCVPGATRHCFSSPTGWGIQRCNEIGSSWTDYTPTEPPSGCYSTQGTQCCGLSGGCCAIRCDEMDSYGDCEDVLALFSLGCCRFLS